jgi:hypothetical protein
MSYLCTNLVYDRVNRKLTALGPKHSENLNKSGKMGACFLKLYRITGEPMFKERAEKIFGHYKAIFRYHQDENRYFWNFWEPLAPFDFKPEGDNAFSWVAVHPYRPGYQLAECDFMVQAYHAGVVFTEDDMRKIVNTNLWMWNQSLADIHFKSSDGTLKIGKSYHGAGEDCGCLWPSLADFDPTLRKIYSALLEKGKNNEVEKAYFKNVTCKEPPSYNRKDVSGQVTLPEIPVCPSKDIIMAVAVPSRIDTGKGQEMRLATKVLVKGRVKVSLLSEDGKKVICDIGEIPISPYKDMFGVSSIKWNGKDSNGKAFKGKYLVRFALNDSTREWRIELTDR